MVTEEQDEPDKFNVLNVRISSVVDNVIEGIWQFDKVNDSKLNVELLMTKVPEVVPPINIDAADVVLLIDMDLQYGKFCKSIFVIELPFEIMPVNPQFVNEQDVNVDGIVYDPVIDVQLFKLIVLTLDPMLNPVKELQVDNEIEDNDENVDKFNVPDWEELVIFNDCIVSGYVIFVESKLSSIIESISVPDKFIVGVGEKFVVVRFGIDCNNVQLRRLRVEICDVENEISDKLEQFCIFIVEIPVPNLIDSYNVLFALNVDKEVKALKSKGFCVPSPASFFNFEQPLTFIVSKDVCIAVFNDKLVILVYGT